MKLRRHKRKVCMRLKARDVSAVVERVRRSEKAMLHSLGLRIRVKEDGSIRARFPSSSRYTPPSLKGRLVSVGIGVELQGIVQESKQEVFIAWLYTFLALFMGTFFVGILLSGEYTNPGLYICGVSAVVFALLAYWMHKQRHGSFNREADELLDQLDWHLQNSEA